MKNTSWDRAGVFVAILALIVALYAAWPEKAHLSFNDVITSTHYDQGKVRSFALSLRNNSSAAATIESFLMISRSDRIDLMKVEDSRRKEFFRVVGINSRSLNWNVFNVGDTLGPFKEERLFWIDKPPSANEDAQADFLQQEKENLSRLTIEIRYNGNRCVHWPTQNSGC